jgi:SAM-dependent methyltransferase
MKPSDDKGDASHLLRAEWDQKWTSSSPGRWAGRPVPAEVIEAVASGWLPGSGRVIDLGCGTAEIAAWFAERGYQATAVDIARAALDRAAARHRGLPIEFIALDLCTGTLPDRSFDILIDRGCLHQIPREMVPDYVRNIASFAAPSARMILFAKAFRRGRPFGDSEELGRHSDLIRRIFAGRFELERSRAAYLNPGNPADPLPGIAYWLTRSP